MAKRTGYYFVFQHENYDYGLGIVGPMSYVAALDALTIFDVMEELSEDHPGLMGVAKSWAELREFVAQRVLGCPAAQARAALAREPHVFGSLNEFATLHDLIDYLDIGVVRALPELREDTAGDEMIPKENT